MGSKADLAQHQEPEPAFNRIYWRAQGPCTGPAAAPLPGRFFGVGTRGRLTAAGAPEARCRQPGRALDNRAERKAPAGRHRAPLHAAGTGGAAVTPYRQPALTSLSSPPLELSEPGLSSPQQPPGRARLLCPRGNRDGP